MDAKIFHSPSWYESRCSEDYTNPRVKSMLLSDMGDWYDDTATPEELVGYYWECWNSIDFISFNVSRMAEIELEEMRSENKVQYMAIMKGYGPGEETYLKVVDEIARDMLLGSDKKLMLFKKRIREEAQKPLQKKKKEQAKRMLKFVGNIKKASEDEKLFTWNNINGEQKDYKKEIHYHICITSLMCAVEERIKMIAVEETKTLRTLKTEHTERMDKVDKLYDGDIEQGWVSRWLQIPIREQNTFIEDFEKNVERIKKDTEAMLSNKETINRVGALMNEKDNNSKRLTGFE